MSWPHNLRTPTSITEPQETGICDRCGFLYPLSRLIFQFDFRGNSLQNLGIRVCEDRCLDLPADQLRPVIIVGPEGVVKDPRPWSYQQQSQGGVPAPTSANPISLQGNPLPGPTGSMILDDETGAPLTDDQGTPFIWE